jgi:hypothetical protein
LAQLSSNGPFSLRYVGKEFSKASLAMFVPRCLMFKAVAEDTRFVVWRIDEDRNVPARLRLVSNLQRAWEVPAGSQIAVGVQ